jgi:hypothetical protein
MATHTAGSYNPSRCKEKDCQVEVFFTTTQGLCLKHHRQLVQDKTIPLRPRGAQVAAQFLTLAQDGDVA